MQGGLDMLADYCAFRSPYSNGWCYDTSNSATTDEVLSQVYSNTSRYIIINLLIMPFYSI